MADAAARPCSSSIATEKKEAGLDHLCSPNRCTLAPRQKGKAMGNGRSAASRRASTRYNATTPAIYGAVCARNIPIQISS